MILARCPACGTTFRVRPEQLEARAGRVRCGHCRHPFDAFEHRLDEAPANELALPPEEPASPLFVLEEKHTEHPAEFPDDAQPAPDDSTAADEAEAHAAPPSFADVEPDEVEEWPPAIAPESTTRDARDDDEPAPPVPPFETSDFQPDWPSATDLELKPASGEPVNFDALLHKQDDDPTPAEALTAVPAEAQPWPASEEPAAMLAQPLATDTLIEIDAANPAPAVISSAETVHTPDAIDTLDARIDDLVVEPDAEDSETDEPPASSPMLRQAAWVAGATLLVLLLLAQGALLFRSKIVQSSPELRPFMESLCAGLGCELPLPRDASKINIESSNIEPDANREAFFTLYATIRNSAEFPQAYPHLEVTLTDARDKALVRKVLEPAQWLPSDAAKDAFGAKRDIAMRVGFEAPGVAAAGYRVYAFYP